MHSPKGGPKKADPWYVDYLRSWPPQQASYYSVEQKKNCNKNLDYIVIKAWVLFNLYKLHYYLSLPVIKQ